MKVPLGFKTSSACCGIKENKRDLALFVSTVPAVCAGTFTKNQVKSGSLIVCTKHIRSEKARVIIVNSGNANALTGIEGIKTAEKITSHYAKVMGLKKEEVLIASTGVIGIALPGEKIIREADRLVNTLSSSEEAFRKSAEAIMTTDRFPKIAWREVKTKEGRFTILALAKGAGMIYPSMATMLCFVFSDFKIGKSALNRFLKKAVNDSFNRITVDGDMSTNDTVLALANGLSGVGGSRAEERFAENLKAILKELALSIVKDGEGSTRIFRVVVEGARTEGEAEKVARQIGNSLLVKTMVYGGEPNYGRIVASAGASGVKIDPFKLTLKVNGVTVVRNGKIVVHPVKKIEGEFVEFVLNLKQGKAKYWLLASDITEDYIKLNAGYMT